MSHEEDYVYRQSWTMTKVKIPKDCEKCPTCEGSGEVRIYYGSPGDRGQFGDCSMCGGRGYVETSFMELQRKIEKDIAKMVKKTKSVSAGTDTSTKDGG